MVSYDAVLLPNGDSQFGSLIFDAENVCRATSLLFRGYQDDTGSPIIGQRLDELCRTETLRRIHPLLERARNSGEVLLHVEIGEYFSERLGVKPTFMFLNIVPSRPRGSVIHVLHDVSPVRDATNEIAALCSARDPGSGFSSLSPREHQVFELIARGYTSKQISAELGISVHTIGNYRKHILKKLGLHSTPDLVALWYQTLSAPRLAAAAPA